jgi:hypothetical protein
MSKPNGHKRKSIVRSRMRVLKAARKAGSITNAEAKAIGRWDQAWFHLNKMCKAGVLRHISYNEWAPVRIKGRPRHDLLEL